MKTHFRKTLLPVCFVLILSTTSPLFAQINKGASTGKLLQAGEEITYVVKYYFFDIGEVKVSVNDHFTQSARTYYTVSAQLDSYENYAVVDLHHLYESVITDELFSVFFSGLIQKGEQTTLTTYQFDYDDSTVTVKRTYTQTGSTLVDSVGCIDTALQDGISMLFYARGTAGADTSITMPALVNEEKVYATLHHTSDVEPIEIEAVEYPVAAFHTTGEASFTSIFGLTGEFEGWFAADESRIPVLGKLNVIIGSITLELMNWKRKAWEPPKHTSAE